ncbi:LysE family translocator [Alkalihalobacillus hwajinpoensis]|uniref:LysE family translocator n=1 Tax=Guptibacillus hwajinpoensis TaxID=208199 RepID=UPI0018839725|nr:LysE family translocator [Pseudalkalibacillus hwajinpoensis]MBF0709118.1 LysE family translocator [Pseudalkalibacillus hwajinpoensis]
MDITIILSFLLAAVLLTVMPGPDNLFVLAQSITQNKQAGIATSLGLCSGLLVHISAATLGISALLYQSTLAFSIVKFSGAAYLLFMAYEAFKDSGSAAKPLSQPSRPYFSLYRKGIVMNILNPKVSLFFLALLPPFVNQQANSPALQMLILGGVFILQAFLIFSAISFFAGKIAFYVVENHALARKFNLAKALLLALIGLQIAFSDQ